MSVCQKEPIMSREEYHKTQIRYLQESIDHINRCVKEHQDGIDLLSYQI